MDGKEIGEAREGAGIGCVVVPPPFPLYFGQARRLRVTMIVYAVFILYVLVMLFLSTIFIRRHFIYSESN